MKISKLFHWLYAFLMFLPITFILPTLAYYGFNDNATAQEYTKEEPIYYQSNEVNNVTDLLPNHIYYWTDNFNDPTLYENDRVVLRVSYFSGIGYLNNRSYIYITSQGNASLVYYLDDTNVSRWFNITNTQGDIVIYSTNFGSGSYTSFANSFEETDTKLVSGYEEVTYTMGITESVNQAIIDTFDLPMFSWATNNVLVAPFSSICSFFGIASTSVLIKYLYYWLTISVIWLVFDVLMYIPLLVHNYIDKARIE